MSHRRHRVPSSSLSSEGLPRARPLRVLPRHAPRHPAAAHRLPSRTPLLYALPFVSRWNTSWATTLTADLDTDHFDGYERHSAQQQHMQHLRGHHEWLLSPLRLLFLHYLMDQGMAPKQRA
eukprot:3231485-Pyramimonas_sp.AAC.1